MSAVAVWAADRLQLHHYASGTGLPLRNHLKFDLESGTMACTLHDIQRLAAVWQLAIPFVQWNDASIDAPGVL